MRRFVVRLTFGSVVLVAVAGVASAQDGGGVLSLAGAVRLALAHQPGVAAASDRARAASHDAEADAALLWPQLGVRGGELFTSGTDGAADFAAANGPREMIGQVVARQGLLDRSARENVIAARAAAAFARFRALDTRLGVAEAVAQAYFALEAQRAAVDVWQAEKRTAEATLAATEQALNAGTRARIDLLRTRLAVSQARQGLEVAQAQAESTARLLALMTGLQGLPPLEAANPPSPAFELPALGALEAEAVRSQPNLAMLRARRDREAAKLAAVRAERLPTIGVEAAVGWDTLALPWRVDPGWSAGVVLTVPLFSSGALGATVEAARSRTEAAERAVEQGRLELTEALAQALGEAGAALAGVRSDERIVPARVEIARISEEGYRAGRLSSLDLSLAREELVRSRLSLVESTARLWLALAKLDLLTGRLPGGGAP